MAGLEPRLLYRSESSYHRFSFFPFREWTEADIAPSPKTSVPNALSADADFEPTEEEITDLPEPDMTSEVATRSELLEFLDATLSEATRGADQEKDMTSSAEVEAGPESIVASGPDGIVNAGRVFVGPRQPSSLQLFVLPQPKSKRK